MQQPVIKLQKTAYTVTDGNGNNYAENGRIYFAKTIARARARELGGMYDPCTNRTSVKEVVIDYTEDGQ